MSRVWITRTAPFNLLTARHLERFGIDALIEPVLDVRPLPVGRPFAAPDALVFTSLHGVRLHRFFPSLSSLPVFAVGGHTARFARLRGYRNVHSAGGDVEDLRGLIMERLEPGSSLVHFSAAQPAGDLVGDLRKQGYSARRQTVYEAVDTGDADLARIAGELPGIAAILVHSPRAGSQVASLLRRLAVTWRGTICSISPAAAKAFEHERVVVAARPTERAMIELCKTVLTGGGDGGTLAAQADGDSVAPN